MKYFQRFCIVILTAALGFSCSTGKNMAKSTDSAKTVADSDKTSLDFLDSASLISKVSFEIPPPKNTARVKVLTDTSQLSSLFDKPVKSDNANEIIHGWRIQIIASENVARANEVYNQAIFKFSEKVYIEFDPPYNRVRVGNCRTRAEAVRLLERVQQNGFPDAWIIRTRIEVEPETGSGERDIH